MFHPNSNHQRIKNILPKTRKGRLYNSISHKDLCDLVVRICHQQGWKILLSRYATNPDGTILSFGVDLDCSGESIQSPEGFSLSLGVVNTTTGRWKIHSFCGLSSKENSFALYEIPHRVSHYSRSGNYVEEITELIDQWADMASYSLAIVKGLREESLSLHDYGRIFLLAGRHKLLPWVNLGKVDKLWEEKGEKNCWNLLECFAKVCKNSPSVYQMRVTAGFVSLLPTRFRFPKLREVQWSVPKTT